MPDYRFNKDLPDRYDDPPPRREVAIDSARLPDFLAKRLLRDGETVESVRGPRACPAWEPYATHPGGAAIGVALGVAIVAIGGLALGSFADPLMAVPCMAALVAAVTGLVVVGIMAGYFTRLVITSERMMIVQGYEVRKTWRLEDLPRSLLRQTRSEDGELRRTVDMESLQTMMGGGNGSFVEAKTIWALGKEIDRQRRENR